MEDRIGFSAATDTLREFRLNAKFEVLDMPEGMSRTLSSTDDSAIYNIPPSVDGELRLRYRGQLSLPADGWVLHPSDDWYPNFDEVIERFELRVQSPSDWSYISHGKLRRDDDAFHWQSERPHQGLYLVGNRYQRYVREHRGIDVSVWLLEPDAALAENYLQHSMRYLDQYSALFGDYPFAKFAVVENAEQTGWGMASFTLLGSRVLRLPFIPFTSLPHEIVHNWLGNGIWVRPGSGNWSEGLTAYLSDYAQKTDPQQQLDYRRKALQRYSNYALAKGDMSLSNFTARHDRRTQAIGYDKSQMLFHMVAQALGEKVFQQSLQRLWQEHAFSTMSFAQLLSVLTADQPALFERLVPWLRTEQVPSLEIVAVKRDRASRMTLELADGNQTGLAMPFALHWQDGDGNTLEVQHLWLESSQQAFTLSVPARAQGFVIDPQLHSLRYLSAAEQAASLNALFARPSWLVLPNAGSASERKAWLEFALTLRRRFPQLQIVTDAEPLPANASRWVLGRDNALYEATRKAVSRDTFAWRERGLYDGQQLHPWEDVVAVSSVLDGEGGAQALVVAPTMEAIETLAHRLPHYGSYGHLLFTADSGAELMKMSLPPKQGPLERRF